jgi:hypothetical protein
VVTDHAVECPGFAPTPTRGRPTTPDDEGRRNPTRAMRNA